MKLRSARPRQPFIGLAIACMSGVLLADAAPNHSPALLVGLAILGFFSLPRPSSGVTYLVVATAFYYLHSLHLSDSRGARFAREMGAEARAMTVRGAVASEPKLSARGFASFLLKLEAVERDGVTRAADATIFVRWRGPVQFGDVLHLFGVVEPSAAPRNPGEFDMRSYLARRDVHHTLLVRYAANGTILRHGGGNFILRAAQKSRDWMQSALARGLEDSPDIQGLISGMVLGVRDETPDEIEERFQQTGTLHLFAVSGLNVAIIAQLLWTLAMAARLTRRWAIALIIPSLFFYAAITGLNTSSVRAALMAAVFLAGYFVDRKVLPLNSVAAGAVLILCYDTNQLFSTGFQLSFAVVAAIILLSDPLFRLLARWSEPDPFLPRSLLGPLARLGQRIWQALARGASVSLAAWIGSLLLIWPYFHLITPISLFANLVVVPIAFFVLAVGLMSLLVTPVVSSLAVIFNNTNWILAWAILGSVEIFARVPGGHIYLEQPARPGPGAPLEITALDLQEGAAVHLRTSGNDWLFDPGGERDFKRIIRPYLRSRGINHLHGLLLTHGDATHIGGASPVLHAFRPRDLIDTAAPDRSSVHKALIAELNGQKISRRLVAAGETVGLSRHVFARVLFPPRGFQASTADDQALVLQLILADSARVLLMADSGDATERALRDAQADLRSDIIIKGQHHSGISASAEFLDAVRPQAIIATSVDYPENRRIKSEWAEMVKTRGIKLFRQDETGAVTLRFSKGGWEIIPYLGTETLRKTTR